MQSVNGAQFLLFEFVGAYVFETVIVPLKRMYASL